MVVGVMHEVYHYNNGIFAIYTFTCPIHKVMFNKCGFGFSTLNKSLCIKTQFTKNPPAERPHPRTPLPIAPLHNTPIHTNTHVLSPGPLTVHTMHAWMASEVGFFRSLRNLIQSLLQTLIWWEIGKLCTNYLLDSRHKF